MKHFALVLLGIALFIFTGCSSSSNTNPLIDGNTVNGVLTCVKGIPDGSKAVVRGSTDTIKLVNGCFDLTNSAKVAARATTNEEDTILVFNDTSLFALTIPFNMLGDTVQMVSTNLNLTNAKNGQFDSILAVVYDKSHIRERFVKMKKAYTNSVVQYHISMYSPVNGSDYLIHYEFHKGDSAWTSELITAERGAEFTSTVSDMNSGSVPQIDTSDVFSEHGVDSIHSIKAKSIYGISKIYVDGIESSTFKDTSWGINIHNIKVVDSAGYVSNVKKYSYVGHDISVDVGFFEKLPNASTYLVKNTLPNLTIDSVPTDTSNTYYYKNIKLKNNVIISGHYWYSNFTQSDSVFAIITPQNYTKPFIF